MKKKKPWGNSIFEVNISHLSCYYCGIPIKEKKWFKIKRMNGHAFAFGEKICEEIWDKKTSV